MLEPAIFELAFHLDRAALYFHLHDDGGVRDAQQFGQHDAGLAEAKVIRLQAGEDEIGLFVLDAAARRLAMPSVSQRCEVVALDVDGAVGALGQRFANGLRAALRAGAERDNLAAMLLFQLQGLFECVGIGLVDLVAEIVFIDPVTTRNRCAGWSRGPAPA